MTIFVNNIRLTVFDGATAIDAVRLFQSVFPSESVHLTDEIYDRFGNPVEPDGRLLPESKLFTKYPINPSDPWQES